MTDVKHRGSKNTAENYKGIPIHAAQGVHQKVAEIVEAHVGKGGSVADVGAGDGALSLRLHDRGYRVTPFDFDNSTWEIKELSCVVVNVENGVSEMEKRGPFNAICAIEIIEHLENPRDFLRQMIGLARAHQAILIVSTPNPLDTFSAISMFTRGVFNWFSPAHYSGGGHISILPHWMISEHLRYLGVERFEWTFCAPYSHPSVIKRVLYNGVNLLRSLFSKAEDRSFFNGQTALVTIYP